jgi:hypothetical protein
MSCKRGEVKCCILVPLVAGRRVLFLYIFDDDATLTLYILHSISLLLLTLHLPLSDTLQ